MTSPLQSLVAFGAYVNAGNLDYYDGERHIRLGEVILVDGEVTLFLNQEGSVLASTMTIKNLKAAFEVDQ